MNHSYTYLAVISTDNYLTGALVLNESLKRTNPRYPFTVMVTKNVSSSCDQILQKHGIRVIRKEENILLDAQQQKKNENVGYKYWNYTFDSLYVFELMEFDKIVYLDCDVLVLENLDHLFEKPHLSAALDPGTTNLSSGIMVIEPRLGALKELTDTIPQVMENKSYFGDQNILQACYPDWPDRQELHLDDKYNAYVCYLHCFINTGKYTFLGSGNNIAVVHFPGPQKPWMRTRKENEALSRDYLMQGNSYGARMLKWYRELLECVNE